MTVTNNHKESLELVLREPEKTGLLIDSIDGLGEPDSRPSINTMGLTDYSRLNNVRLEPREIEIKLLFIGDDIEANRLMAYKYFPTNTMVTLRFKTDYRDVICTGVVTKHDPVIFSKECGCDISIKCPDPYFYSTDEFDVIFASVEPLFHFPFSDSEENEIQFGALRITKNKSIYYMGEKEASVIMDLRMNGTVENLALYNVTHSQQMAIDMSFIEGDEVIISTGVGKKSAYLIRDGIRTNILKYIVFRAGYDDWIKLYRGDNEITYTASTGDNDVIMNVTYQNVYKGV
jgi:hypothetical protein